MREKFERVFLKGKGLHAGDSWIKFDEPLKAHTSLRTGGRAAVFARPEGLDPLKELLLFARDEGVRVHLLGGGTNVLVTDGYHRALFIQTGGFKGIEILNESGGARVKASCGEALKGLLSYCQKAGLSGLEGLSGIPGSVGGAVLGNSGSFGMEIKDSLASADVLGPDGEMKTLTRDQMGFRYRGTALGEDEAVVSAEFLLRRDEPEAIKEKMNDFFEIKKKSQPISEHSAGCVFKNPEGASAGRLIEEAGLKGTKTGGVMISPVHANFFVNTGGGTAADFLALMDMAREKVLKQTGIPLEPEIRIVKDESYG